MPTTIEHTDHCRREATRTARLKGHSLSRWRRIQWQTTYWAYCVWCERRVTQTGWDLRGSALEFECDAAPARTGAAGELEAGVNWGARG